MRLASKGLGRLTLPFDLGKAALSIAEEKLWFQGRIKEKKVNWDYRLRLDEPDIVNFVRLARHPQIIQFLARQVGGGLLKRVGKQAGRTLLYFLRLSREQPTSPPTEHSHILKNVGMFSAGGVAGNPRESGGGGEPCRKGGRGGVLE